MYIKRKLPISMLFVFVLALLCANSVYAVENVNTPLENKTPEEVKNLILNDTNSIPNCVLNCANNTSVYIKEKNEVPSNVRLSKEVTVTTPQFLQLMSCTIQYLDELTSSDASKANDAAANYDKFIEELMGIIKTDIKPAPDPLDGIATGEIKKADYIDMAKRLSNFIKTNGRLPNYVNTPLGKLGCDVLVREFSNILNSYKIDGKLPDKITLKIQGSSLTLDQIMKNAARFSYISGSSTLESFLRLGGGDCWAMSEYLYSELTKAGIRARIIQYATAYASNHRSVQYFKNGAWLDLPYRDYPINMLFRNTYSKPGMFVVKGG